ncbi:Stk1 family PASTA domain-containing Ser/Thr kinase [Mycolicibacterium sp. P1-18]|uniref:Stk1 family PASTA domain-containing Ser/Thr kinase n=1 Tax=Mycolicibacterium sp. P1-18 TaxID=2024615 RepID=UPI0011F2694A|nr:Stk1 family PASTA domain-containing Ser/Thr kinase [Mycolicibacterium sp. P1-18]KAA0097951.1 Stk1 family PASTA domain-containing Ser/Thr kinase [Mycolicibacterium sp. P1-18]
MTTPQRLSDRYELGEILGFGGMSEVHLARDVRLHRDVAVKVLRADLARDPTFFLRFSREARNAAGLNHPAIVAVYDSGEADTPDGPLPYIVMEYVDGVTLRDVIRNDGPVDPRRAVEIIADACQALNYSHQHGIVHRDVKPANIMIDRAGAVKVMDFGIARALHDDGAKLTQTSAVIGTAQYLSPEQASGETVDARSDVYSLGCVFYELLTGEPPFIGDTPVSVAYQHVRKDPPPPSRRNPALSPDLDAVVLKSLAKNPANRYQTAAEMRDDLIRVRDGLTPSAPKVFTDAEHADLASTSPGHRRAARAGGSGRRWLAVGAVLTVLAVVVALAVNVFVGDRQRVPDLRGQGQADAQVSLQNLGFKTIVNPEPNSTVQRGLVISTDPGADSTARVDDTIAINVSSGPEQRQVPDVSNLSPAEAAARLTQAGFGDVGRSEAAHPTVPKGAVSGTSPPAGTSVAVTDQITILISTGPGAVSLPDVVTQPADVATKNLTIAGFTKILTAPVDSLLPAGQVVATDPPAGTELPVDAPVTVKVSKGNQVLMPDLSGKFHDDVVQRLAQLGFTVPVTVGPAVDAGAAGHFRVVQQDPPANTPVNRDATVTVDYGS